MIDIEVRREKWKILQQEQNKKVNSAHWEHQGSSSPISGKNGDAITGCNAAWKDQAM